MDGLETHYENAFSNAENGNIYQELAPLDRLAHNRRVALLESLALPSLSEATVVDYGVGAWGVGAVFAKLKAARKMIGIDISSAAVAMSRTLTAHDPAMQGADVEYHTASGYALPLASESIDVFFSGECIEHIEDTDLHLIEVQRVLKVGGIAIFTTPNGDPWVYRQFGLRWCVGFEHVALMSTHELVDYLGRYFAVENVLGFNQSMHPTLDKNLPEQVASQWVSSGEKDPYDATSVIALVRKESRSDMKPLALKAANFDAAQASGPSQDLDLSFGYKGRMIEAGGSLSIPVPVGAIRCNLILWSHSWSGSALIEAGSDRRTVDLYSHVGGCRRITLTQLDGCTTIAVKSLGKTDERSESTQVIFFRAVFAVDA